MATKKTKKTEAAPAAEPKPAAKKRTSAHRSPTTAKRAAKKAPAIAKRETESAPVAPAPVPSPDQLREQIATLAYHLWIDSGYQHGRDQEHWQRAEELVLSRYSAA
jgi:hypothetical protein